MPTIDIAAQLIDSQYQAALFLHSLLNDDIEEQLDRFGTIEEYVQTVFRDSDNPGEAEIVFKHTLRTTIAELSVEHKAPHYLLRVLDLLISFRPRGGAEVAAQILNTSSRRHRIRTSPAPQTNDYLGVYTRAMIALEIYFPVPVSQSSGTLKLYEYYIESLHDARRDPEVAAEATRRLLELGELSLKNVLSDHRQLRGVHRSLHKQYLAGSLRYAISSPSQESRSEACTLIYQEALHQAGGNDLFEEILDEDYGATLQTIDGSHWPDTAIAEQISVPEPTLEFFIDIPGLPKIALFADLDSEAAIPWRVLSQLGHTNNNFMRSLREGATT